MRNYVGRLHLRSLETYGKKRITLSVHRSNNKVFWRVLILCTFHSKTCPFKRQRYRYSAFIAVDRRRPKFKKSRSGRTDAISDADDFVCCLPAETKVEKFVGNTLADLDGNTHGKCMFARGALERVNVRDLAWRAGVRRNFEPLTRVQLFPAAYASFGGECKDANIH